MPYKIGDRATKKKTQLLDGESGAALTKERLYTYVEFCGHRVTISRADVMEMKRLSNSKKGASLLLLGFQPMQSMSKTLLVGKAFLAFSNDRLVQGSGKAFYNLKDSMLRKGVYAVGELLTRSTSTSKMVAIVPQCDPFGGFLIIPSPFKDDIRLVPGNDIGFADRKTVDAAKSLISKSILLNVRLGEDFENPVLKYFFNYLESVSLGKELEATVEDDAKMDVQQMIAVARKEIESFSLILPEEDATEKTDRKRKQLTYANNRTTNISVVHVDDEWIEMYKNDAVADCSANELKAFLRSVGERYCRCFMFLFVIFALIIL